MRFGFAIGRVAGLWQTVPATLSGPVFLIRLILQFYKYLRMKKFLLSMAAAMTMAGANAGVVELNVNDATDIQGTLVEETMKPDGSVQAAKHYEDLTSLQLGGYGFTFTHVSGNNAPTYYYATSTNPKQQCDIRVYNEATMTITAPAGQEILSIEFSGSKADTKNPGKYQANTGSLNVASASAMNWTGNATAITFTYQASYRISTLKIETGTSSMETLEAPVFTPASGTTFGDDGLAVTIAGPEGAAIYYTLDGSMPSKESNLYDAPIALTATTTVKAIAVKEGMNDSPVATATYTKDMVMKTLADIVAAGLEDEKTEFTYGGNAVVTYVNGQNLYVRDESASLLLYNKDGFGDKYANGDILTGFKGTFKNYYSTYEMMVNAESMGEAVKGEAAQPVEINIGTLTEKEQNSYVILKGATIKSETIADKTTVYAQKDGDEIAMYDKFKIEIADSEKAMDIVAIVSYYQQKGADAPELQLYPISINEASGVEAVEGEEAQVYVLGGSIIAPEGAEVYSVNGARVNANGLAAGVYVVRLADGNAVKVLVK